MKRTFATTYRGDIRTVATITSFFIKRGQPIRNLSEVVRLGMEAFKEIVIEKYPELTFETTDNAVFYLEEMGMFDASIKFRNKRTLLEELSIESLTAEGLSTQYAKHLSVKGEQVSVKEAAKLLESKLGPEVSQTLPEEDIKVKNILSRPPWVDQDPDYPLYEKED